MLSYNMLLIKICYYKKICFILSVVPSELQNAGKPFFVESHSKVPGSYPVTDIENFVFMTFEFHEFLMT